MCGRKDGVEQPVEALHGDGGQCGTAVIVFRQVGLALWDNSLTQEDVGHSSDSFKTHPGMLSGPAALHGFILERVFSPLAGPGHMAWSSGGVVSVPVYHSVSSQPKKSLRLMSSEMLLCQVCGGGLRSWLALAAASPADSPKPTGACRPVQSGCNAVVLNVIVEL